MDDEEVGMRCRSWVGLAAPLLLVTTAAAGPAGAEPDNDAGVLVSVREQVVDLMLQELKANAKHEEVLDEKFLLDVKGIGATRRPTASRELFDREIPEGAPPHAKAAVRMLDTEIGQADRDAKKAELIWRTAMARRLEFLSKKAEAEVDRSERKAQRGEAGWSLQGVLALGAALAVTGLVLALHDHRRWARWKLRAVFSRPGRTGSVIALAVAVASAGWDRAGDGDNRAQPGLAAAKLTAKRDELTKKVARIETAISDAEKELDDLLDKRRDAEATFGLEPVTDSQKARAKEARSVERKLQQQYRNLMVTVRTTRRLANETEKLVAERPDDMRELKAALADNRARSQGVSIMILVATGMLLLGIMVPLNLARLRRWRAFKLQGRQCPRCLEKDSLAAIPAADPTDYRMPKVPLLECSLCKYEIRQNYINQDRLCFPTLGVRASGKTHWMVMLYDQIKNGNVPVAADLRKVPSREDARFDQLVRQVLCERSRPAPNVLNLPYPLNFQVRDADRFGRSNAMINLFDFAGELRELKIDLDPFRRRALLCEGFTFFLDPTQVTAGAGFDIEDQIQTLEEFAADLHAMHNVPIEQAVELPVAVCISKIDLLAAQNPIGAQADGLVAEFRKTIGRKPELGLIHERSQLCARLLPLMFPGWNVESVLRRHFGGRFLFFPISSIGLEGAEQGSDDHAARTITPFGVIEPLLWLLHMHGYVVFR
jgi:hypothetical protein